MDTKELYYKIYGWIDMILNPPTILESDRVEVIIADEDFSAPEFDSPYIVIGYTPTGLTPPQNGGSRLDPQLKSTNGIFKTGDTYGNLTNFHGVSDGSLLVAVDGEAAVDITELDFTEDLSMTEVAITLQQAINAAIPTKSVVVDFVRGDANYFQFMSESIPVSSESIVSSIVLSASGTGTDIFTDSFLNGGESTPGVEDSGYEQIHLIDYQGVVEIRQVYGDGEYLQKLVNTRWHNKTAAYFAKNKFSLLDMGNIQGVPFREGNRTIKESMMDCRFYFYGNSREDVAIIENIGIDGVIENADSSQSHEISIGG